MNPLLEILSIPLVQTILKIIFMIMIFAMPLGTLMTLMERKWSAMVQDRVGPNRANVGNFRGRGLAHIAADGLKSIFKEDTIPEGSDRFLYLIAPFFGLIAGVSVFAIVPIAAPIGNFTFQITDIDPGLLFIFAITSLSVYGAVLAGASSNSKFALLGGTRASAQMISYEIALGVSIIGVVMVYGTMDLSELVRAQGQTIGGWIPFWGIVTQPVAFFVFVTAALAETKRPPFDLPEAESEIIGYFVEYSGMKFGMFFLTDFLETIMVACVATTLFLGGWQVPYLQPGDVSNWTFVALGMASFSIKVIIFCWVFMQLRWTLPRFRYDQLMTLGWKGLFPIAIANVIVTAVVLVFLGEAS